MKIKFSTSTAMEIGVCFFLSLVVIISWFFSGPDQVQSFFLIPMFFFLVGHSELSILYPKAREATEQVSFSSTRDARRPPEGFERFLLSVIFSVTSSSAILFVMAIYEIGDLESFRIVLSVTYLILGLLSFSRAIYLPEDERFRYDFEITFPEVRQTEIGTRAIAAALLLAVIFVFPDTIRLILDENDDGFTEFYILNSDYNAGDYEISLQQDELITTIIGVSNNEGEFAEYTLEVTKRYFGDDLESGEKTSEVSLIESLSVESGETEFLEYAYSFDVSGNWKVDFDLHLEKNSSVDSAYRNLHLWIIVQ